MRRIALLVILALATPAEAFVSNPRLRVTQLSNGDFVVEYNSQARLTDYWCAAGNFVTNTMRLPDRTRVFRASPPPRKAGKGITFSLDAAHSVGDTGLSTYGGPQDGSFSAGSAYSNFCSLFYDDF